MKKIIKTYISTATKCLLILSVILFAGCESQFDFDLPEEGSIADTVPPKADFSFSSSIDDFKTIRFSDQSIESTTFFWDFGNGATSEERDPVFTFPGEGVFPVTLTASDALGQSDMITIDVPVVEGPFQPVIVEAGFEDGTLLDGNGDGRDSWRNNDIGGVIQITSSPVFAGDQGAKLPSDQTRIGYQEIQVEPNTNYDLTFWYTMFNDSSDPFVVVSILGVTEFGPFTSREEAAAGTIASVTVNDTEDPAVYVEQDLSFNSGENDFIAIYFFNGPVEARLDNFSIEVGLEGSVPPSVGFEFNQSPDNFLEYTFTNSSTGGATFLWDFGDGNTSTEESPTHVYAVADMYTVTLEVTNDAGLSADLNKPLDIQAPVTVDFTFEEDPDDFRTIQFMDASDGAVSLLWEFGDGFQFTGMNPEHTYMEDGIFTVTLTATSVTGLQDSKSLDVTIAQGFIASIKESSFEDDDPSATCTDADGVVNMDGRDCWRNSLGGVIQITSGPLVSGSQAAKLPSAGDRVGYQRVEVEANTDYVVSFYYTMKTDNPGSLTVAVLDDSNLSDLSEVPGATIIGGSYNDQTDADAYVLETLSFNSGDNTQIGIFFHNEGVECRLDDFSID